MNKFKISQLLFILSALILTASCIKDDNSQQQEDEKRLIANYIATNNITVTPSASGLYIVPTKTGTGGTPQNGDMTLINYRLKDISGVLASTNDSAMAGNASGYIVSQFVGGPYKFVLSDNNLGLKEGLMSMKEGGKATLVVPSILWSADYKPVVIDVELLKVIKDPIAFEKEQIGFFLDSICRANNKPVLTYADSTKKGITGVYYIETLKGSGDSIVDGKTVVVDYTVNLISYKNIYKERRLDKGAGYESILFNTNPSKSTNIVGFDEGIRHMRKGGKGIVVIPYHRSYGVDGIINQYNRQIIIPRYSTLVYYIEVKDVK